jgi:hypothetical protein
MTDDFTRIIDARLREIHTAWRAKGHPPRHDEPRIFDWPITGWMAAVGDSLGAHIVVDRHPTALAALDALADAVAAAPVNADADLGVV